MVVPDIKNPFHFIIVGVDAADCKIKFIGWFRDLVKGKAGGDTCIVKDINGQSSTTTSWVQNFIR